MSKKWYYKGMQTIFTNEQKSAVEERTFRDTAEALVVRMGIRADLGGNKCLIDAVILYGTELCTRFCELYRVIGEYRGKNPKSVMREISYAIKQAYDISGNLSALLGVNIPESDIHSSLVIAYLGDVFRNPRLIDDKREKTDRDKSDKKDE